MKSLEESSKQREEMVSQDSFQDLETLMQKASELAKLAETLLSKVTPDEEEDEDLANFRKELRDFGISEPVTRETVKSSEYHQALAKELDQFLTRYCEKAQVKQLSLSDTFCLFNRARGIGNRLNL